MSKGKKGAYVPKPDEPIYKLPPYKVERVVMAASEIVDWGLEMFTIPSFWKQTQGEGIKVAVLDTGIDSVHPDISDAIRETKDFSNSPSGPTDVDGHGTHVSGIIAARKNSQGVVGVAPKAELYIGKVLGDNGYGSSRGISDGIRWATEKGVNIISMSLGSSFYDESIHNAVKDAVSNDVFVICAAGNEGPRLNTVSYPGALPETIAVGSIDRRRKVSYFSSRGGQVDVVAPGDEILSTYPPGGFAVLSGTSMAAPFVSGVVALILSKHRDFGGETPIESQAQLIQHLRKTAIDAGPAGFDPDYGFGLINPEQLLLSHSSNVLNLVLGEDITEAGLAKVKRFIDSNIDLSIPGQMLLEGSVKNETGEIQAGISIKS